MKLSVCKRLAVFLNHYGKECTISTPKWDCWTYKLRSHTIKRSTSCDKKICISKQKAKKRETKEKKKLFTRGEIQEILFMNMTSWSQFYAQRKKQKIAE